MVGTNNPGDGLVYQAQVWKEESEGGRLVQEPSGCHVSAVTGGDSTADDSTLDIDKVRKLQQEDPDLLPMLDYLKDGELPHDNKTARRIIVESSFYTMLDNMLHHENPSCPGRMCVMVPKELRSKLIE